MKRSFTITVDATEGQIAQESRIAKEFKGIREIRVRALSGGCLVERGGSSSVKVEAASTFRQAELEPRLEQLEDRLILEERFKGPALSGDSAWRLLVPDGIRIQFSSVSGPLEVQGLKAEIEARLSSGSVTVSDLKGSLKVFTSSGRIKASNIEGQIALFSSSGDVLLAGCRGSFDVKCSSGNIVARAILPTAPSSFSSSSGDAKVFLEQSPLHDLRISSSCGDADLNLCGNPIGGFVRMTSKSRIEAPFEFDEEEAFFKRDQKYVTKTATLGADSPQIEIASDSGKAVLREG